MKEKKLFFDESNISKNKDDSNLFLIGAACVVQNDNIFEHAQIILNKHGIYNEIKGSKIMTKGCTNLRAELVEKIFPKLDITIIIYDFLISDLLDFTLKYIQMETKNHPIQIYFLLNIFLIKNFMKEIRDEFKNSSIINYHNLIEKAYDLIKEEESNENNILRKILLNIKKNMKYEEESQKDPQHNYSILLMAIYEIINNKDSSIKYRLVIDDFFDKDENGREEFLKKIKNIPRENNNLSDSISDVIFDSSENNIGLQIADWCVSMTRKTIKELLDKYWVETVKKINKKSVFNEVEEEWGNELLKIIRSLFYNREDIFLDLFVLTFEHKSFIEILISTNININEILGEEFLILVEEHRIKMEKRKIY